MLTDLKGLLRCPSGRALNNGYAVSGLLQQVPEKGERRIIIHEVIPIGSVLNVLDQRRLRMELQS